MSTKWQIVVDFTADTEDDANQLYTAISVQSEGMDGIVEVEAELIPNDTEWCCGACGQLHDGSKPHVCDLDPQWDYGLDETGRFRVHAEECMVVSVVLLPTLSEVAWLMHALIRLATQYEPRWIEADDNVIHWDKGATSMAAFRDYYRETR